MIDWEKIHTVLLDMDGTLLDLHFDNYFWQQHVPKRYAEKHDLSFEDARQLLMPRFRSREGTMQWYCVDFWTKELGLDIALLKAEIDHLIAVHPHVVQFLDRLRELNKYVALVTNAHQKSLMLKMDRTELSHHFDTIICAHDFGMPKEDIRFWDNLKQCIDFDNQHTLMVDDSLPVLRSARNYGIQYTLAVLEPDSKTPRREVSEFDAIVDFSDIMP